MKAGRIIPESFAPDTTCVWAVRVSNDDSDGPDVEYPVIGWAVAEGEDGGRAVCPVIRDGKCRARRVGLGAQDPDAIVEHALFWVGRKRWEYLASADCGTDISVQDKKGGMTVL